MEDIQFMLKPDWVTWQDIKNCMIKAHEPLRKKGVVMQNQTMSVEEFETEYKDTTCFVALKDKEVVGMCSCKITKVKMWWHKGDIFYSFGDAIIPEYRGTDVYLGLQKIRLDYIKQSGVRVLFFNTEENNKLVQKLNMKKGAKCVKFYASPKTSYYSVVMARWLDGCPYSDGYCNFRYNLSKFLVKTLWKPGRIVRILPLRDADYKKMFDHYQLCSDMISAEDFCKKMDIKCSRFIKWGKRHNKI